MDLLDLSSDSEAMECMFGSLIRSNVSINIGCTYISSHNNHDDFTLQFEDKLRVLNLNSSTCTVCGDFNYDLYKFSDDNRS